MSSCRLGAITKRHLEKKRKLLGKVRKRKLQFGGQPPKRNRCKTADADEDYGVMEIPPDISDDEMAKRKKDKIRQLT